MTKAKIQHRATTLTIRRTDHDILASIYRYQCLTALQVTKLVCAPTSFKWVSGKLKRLSDAGYLVRSAVPVKLTDGRPPLYYGLGVKGLAHLASYGVDVPDRARPYHVRGYSDPFISHLLAVNEFLIAGDLFSQQVPTITLVRMLHQQDFERRPVPVRIGSQSTKVKFDGFLDFEVYPAEERAYRKPIFLELDRATERRDKWQQKVRGLVGFMRGALQETFGRQALTIAVVVTTNRERLISLVTWTREVLVELQANKKEVGAFHFATFPLDWNTPAPQRPTPDALFLAPRWYPAFEPEPVPIFTTL
jgi:hypothetical protein